MLTTKQRAALRAIANGIDPIIHIGKTGINDNLIKQCDDALTAREILKGTVLENSTLTAKQALNELCPVLRAEPVQAIGRKFVIYRRNFENTKIALPR
jgi:RNA-binding protein